MRWAIKHKSGRTLFVTSDGFIANNRKEMGWIVEEVKMTSREQFEKWVKEETGFDLWRTEYPMTEWDNQQYKCHQTNLAWLAWQESRAAIEIELLADKRRMDWLVSKAVNVREPMVYGSHSMFWSQAITDEEDDYYVTKLREQIDVAMESEKQSSHLESVLKVKK
ncbi:hypothetical protein [Salmonella phage gmqsjt-1]